MSPRAVLIYCAGGRLFKSRRWVEMGIYYRPAGSSSNKKLDAYYADTSFTMPMDLYLYNYYGENSEQIFGWNPNEEQWWITCFDPEHAGTVDVHKQVIVGSVTFNTKTMYDHFVESNAERTTVKNYIICDENNMTVWIMWYDKETI